MQVDRPDQAPVAIRGVLCDLLMAVMNSLEVWTAAAGDEKRGLAWRDETTARMAATDQYVPYEDLVAAAAAHVGLRRDAAGALFERWSDMRPWPDARAAEALAVPYGFVTNCSAKLARIAGKRSGLNPRFVLSAEQAGSYKPSPRIYREGCRMLGTAPGRTGFVAGSPYDAAGARVSGLYAWLVIRRKDHRASESSTAVATSLHLIVEAINERSLAGHQSADRSGPIPSSAQ